VVTLILSDIRLISANLFTYPVHFPFSSLSGHLACFVQMTVLLMAMDGHGQVFLFTQFVNRVAASAISSVEPANDRRIY
jgi:ABC-type uncharacterized transport system permease subunit